MRIACVYWFTRAVGGIATILNNIRTAALCEGDTFDILHSRPWKRKSPKLFSDQGLRSARKWISGGDTNIWVDGEIPQTEEASRWLEANYDAVYFGYICPHRTKDYPTPEFMTLYENKLPKVACIMDGHWETYSDWAIPCLPKLNAVLVVQEAWTEPIAATGYDRVYTMLQPFTPAKGPIARREIEPLLVWPCQWLMMKGTDEFIAQVPELVKQVRVELYSSGRRYFAMRNSPVWQTAVGRDVYRGTEGNGQAIFYGNIDVPEMLRVYQRAWFTVCLQGSRATKETYLKGSYNLTEVEALFYGACPILHDSVRQTGLPEECYITVAKAEDIPDVIRQALKSGFVLDETRQKKAREWVLDTHLASRYYQKLRPLWG